VATIFIVDDQEPVRRGFRRALESDGHDVVEFADGREAFDAAVKRPPDLVVSDIYMPDGDGITLITKLNEHLPTVAILAVSGGPYERTSMVLEDAGLFGARAVLQKPVSVMALRSTATSLLRSAPHGAEGAGDA